MVNITVLPRTLLRCFWLPFCTSTSVSLEALRICHLGLLGPLCPSPRSPWGPPCLSPQFPWGPSVSSTSVSMGALHVYHLGFPGGPPCPSPRFPWGLRALNFHFQDVLCREHSSCSLAATVSAPASCSACHCESAETRCYLGIVTCHLVFGVKPARC